MNQCIPLLSDPPLLPPPARLLLQACWEEGSISLWLLPHFLEHASHPSAALSHPPEGRGLFSCCGGLPRAMCNGRHHLSLLPFGPYFVPLPLGLSLLTFKTGVLATFLLLPYKYHGQGNG